jgi:hypothetical protein
MKKTLAQSFCESHHVASDQFEQAVLRRCLYPQARLLRPLLQRLNPDYFEADLELIRAAGRLTHSGDFAAEALDYSYHPSNSGRMRREWRMRLSVTRLRALVIETLRESLEEEESGAPFATFFVHPDAEHPEVRVVAH